MITGHIIRQHLNLCNSHVVADTIDYLEAKFIFKTDDWDGLEVWAHFAKDSTVYDIRLTEDCIRKEDHLNLSAGMWKVYLHGNEFRDGKVIQRITTDEAVLYVLPTGTLDGEPFPEMPASVTEQILARLENVEQNGGGGSIELDTTLTESGKAADAKAVGDKMVRDVSVQTEDELHMTLEYPLFTLTLNDGTKINANLPKLPKVYEILMLEAAPDYDTEGYTGQLAYVTSADKLYVCIEGYTGNGIELRPKFFWSPVTAEIPYIIKYAAPTDTDHAPTGFMWVNARSGGVYIRYGDNPVRYKWGKISLPESTSADEGKVLTVVDGAPKWADAPSGGGGINVTYDETTGNLTITSSSGGGVAFDETTGNLAIGIGG